MITTIPQSITEQREKATAAKADLELRLTQARNRIAEITRRQTQADQNAIRAEAARLVVGAHVGESAAAEFAGDFDGDLAEANRVVATLETAIEMQSEVLSRLHGEEMNDVATHVKPEYGKAVTRVCLAILELRAAVNAERQLVREIYNRGMLVGLSSVMMPGQELEKWLIVGAQFYLQQAQAMGYYEPGEAVTREETQ